MSSRSLKHGEIYLNEGNIHRRKQADIFVRCKVCGDVGKHDIDCPFKGTKPWLTVMSAKTTITSIVEMASQNAEEEWQSAPVAVNERRENLSALSWRRQAFTHRFWTSPKYSYD